MKTVLISVVTCILFFACKNSKDNTISASSSIKDSIEYTLKIDAIINSYENLDFFSGIVLVAEKGDIIYHKAIGMADRTLIIENRIHTLFDIGSMNKTFTAIVIKQLAAEGKLNLESKLVDHLSGFEDANANKININHLLAHESGFGDYHTPTFFELPKKDK